MIDFNIIEKFCNMTEKEQDAEIFKCSEYDGMDFVRLESWDNFDYAFASPRFKFENGDIVVFDKQGNLFKIKD